MEIERASANKFWQRCLIGPLGCLHGRDNMTIPNDHPVSKFIDDFFIDWTRRKQKDIAMFGFPKDMFRAHPQVWKDFNYRELAKQFFISIGTNMLLAKDINDGALSMAKTIVALEHYNSSEGLSLNSVFFTRSAASKRRDLEIGSISMWRDLLKFYRKRLSCKCLKRKHLEARKAIPKMGKCTNCNIEKERVELSVCSRCMVMQYCSRECQVAAWPTHKEECDKCHKYTLKQQQIKEKKQQLDVILAKDASKVRKSLQENKQHIYEGKILLKELKLKLKAESTKVESKMIPQVEEKLSKLEKMVEEQEMSLVGMVEEHERSVAAVLGSKC